MTTEVLIVGAGPTGLALAVALGQLGIQPKIIDQASSGAAGSRAVALHSRTLEILQMLGVAGEVVTSGQDPWRECLRERQAYSQLQLRRARQPFSLRYRSSPGRDGGDSHRRAE